MRNRNNNILKSIHYYEDYNVVLYTYYFPYAKSNMFNCSEKNWVIRIVLTNMNFILCDKIVHDMFYVLCSIFKP